jgi:hypothetical protein
VIGRYSRKILKTNLLGAKYSGIRTSSSDSAGNRCSGELLSWIGGDGAQAQVCAFRILSKGRSSQRAAFFLWKVVENNAGCLVSIDLLSVSVGQCRSVAHAFAKGA